MTEPIAAHGTGAEKFDAPALFYLANQAQIDEWYALRSTVSEALGEWFRTTVRDALAARGEALGYEASEARGPSGYHSVVLHTPGTVIQNTKPVIGIGVAWSAKNANPVSNKPFATVRCSRNDTGRAAAKAFLSVGGQSYRKNTPGVHGGDTDAWPVYRWLEAPDQWWTNLDAYRDSVVDTVIGLSTDLHDALAVGFATESTGSTDETE